MKYTDNECQLGHPTPSATPTFPTMGWWTPQYSAISGCSRGRPSTDVYICQNLLPLRLGAGPAGWGGDWDIGIVWRLCEYKGVNEGNILPRTPLTHTTTPHTLRDPRGRSPQERLTMANAEQLSSTTRR